MTYSEFITVFLPPLLQQFGDVFSEFIRLFVPSFLQLLGEVSWPVAVVLVVYLLRADIRELLKKMRLSKLKYGEMEVDLVAASDAVERATENVETKEGDLEAAVTTPTNTPAPTTTPPPTPAQPYAGWSMQELLDVQALRAEALLAPVSAIVRMWERVAEEAAIVTSRAKQHFPLVRLALMSIDDSAAEAYLKLRNVRNTAVHAPETVTPEVAMEFVETAIRLLLILKRLPKKDVD
ncbi:hypothetical protein DES53_102769 [Roseimicrobium gellanilyticum]|uniref:DUF4145 domain-containing protein n=1 Tax=Roseimicrobium gellanilyticum TaxID=748857 RepID=A0A366HTF7_9BACT|nr:hypothetical protein [Roseimicrobium gellanilyticum]RBP46378.1 hypothetical protein DES53_102769 [Roseimicrobium gellanilyticum]